MDRTVLTSTTDTAEEVKAAVAAGDTEEVAEEAAAETETAEEEEVEPVVAKPAKGAVETVESLKAKIKRMTYEQHRAVDYAEQQRSVNDSLTTRLAELEKKMSPPKEEVEEVPAFPDPEPTLEDAETIEAWAKEHGEWVAKKTRFEMQHEFEVRDKKVVAKEVEETQKEFEARVQTEHETRLEAFRAEHPDFDDVAQEAVAQKVPLTPPMLAHIMQSDTGPALLYYLGKNPKVAKEIAALKAGPTLVRLGRIEAHLEAEAGKATDDGAEAGEGERADIRSRRPLVAATGPKKPLVPPAPLAGRGGKNTKDPQKMSFGEYKAWRAAGGGR